ncbi:MAG: hypothetical protein I3273_00820 [Candidatus Moeniiplasma glomeromycotorum]|nr:hypothetical protein [Candidatus Moeniiplasma glomeromycotorum]MCE8167334.1 hypothetical protein [Candidatus Moeniiplasma glomeromycotorum]MCE8168653.1 hypothetical protein [Candidatus Moeniiplasma glomeromycotorum]
MSNTFLKNFVIFQNQARNLNEYYTILDKVIREKYFVFKSELERREWEDLIDN